MGPARGHTDPDEARAAREALAVKFWRRKFIDGLSYPQIAEAEQCSTGHAFNLVQEGLKVVQGWQSKSQQSEALTIALERLEFLWATSKTFFEKGSPKHGAILCKVADMHHDITGLKKLDVRGNAAMSGAEVLDRVKQVTGRVISPLVAEKLPALPEAA